MQRRTVGVEEELLLVEPATRAAAPRSQQVLKYAAEHGLGAPGQLDHELFRHQLETRTSPATDLADLRRDLVAARRAAADAAAGVGLLTAASGAVPLPSGEPRTTRDDRYLAMVETFGEVARPGGTCGMHVHVHISSEEEGVSVIDGITPWLPVLLAVSANSPFYHGRDTRYASWRSHSWSQWPSAGPVERFGTLETYREVSRQIVESGAALDEGMLYFDARLARAHPTIEVRITDVCTDPDDAILLAALVRALVAHAANGIPNSVPWRVELLRAARWRAARYGLADRLLDPVTGEARPAREVLEHLLATVREPLEDHGDAGLVHDALARVLSEGGSVRQRAAYERNGGSVAAVVDDLVERTNAAGRVSP